ncbi:hypothetical protein SEVIR_5G268966v4 [Setaria viridis]
MNPPIVQEEQSYEHPPRQQHPQPERPNPSPPHTRAPGTKSRRKFPSHRNPQLVKSTKPTTTTPAKIKPQEIQAPATLIIPSHPSLSIDPNIPFNLPFFPQSRRPQQLLHSHNYERLAQHKHQTTLHSHEEKQNKTKEIQSLSPQAKRGRGKKGLVFISCTEWQQQQRSKPNPQRRSAWVIISQFESSRPSARCCSWLAASPNLLRHIPILLPLRSSPHPPIHPRPRRCSWCSSYCWCHYSFPPPPVRPSVLIFLRRGDPAAHRFAFFVSTPRGDAGGI